MEKVANLKDLSGKTGFCIEAKGKKLGLYKIGSKVYCLEGECTHRQGPVCKGVLAGKIVTCPWHGSQFDVTTGKVVGGPATKDLKSYKVEVKGDEIWVNL